MTANKKKLPTKRSKYRTADIEDIEFKQLFDDMNESVAVIDPKDASFVYVNKSFVKQVGYSRKEIDNMHVMDLHLNYNSISLWKKHVAVLKKRKLLIDTASFRGKRGDVRNIEVRLKYIGGKPGRVIAVIRDVTDQTNIEKELTSISCFPEENPNPVLRLDKDMKVLYTNSAFKTLLKRYRCPIKSMFRILPKEFKRLIKKTLRDDMVIRNIHAVNRGDIYSYDITPVIDKNYVNIYGSNITTQERALEDIKAMASEWYRTFDAIEDLVFIQDVNYNIVRANKAFFKFIKKKPKEIIGKKCYSILHKRKSPWLNCPFEKTRKDNKYHSEEVDDSIIGMPILVSTSPIKDDSGKLLGSVHIAKDISKFKESEEKLRNSEEKYRTLYDSSDDAIMILDPKSIKFLSANPATIRLFKCTSEKEFLSHTVMSFSPKIQPDGSKTALKAKEMIKSVLKSGSQYFEWRHKKIDGEEFDASVLLNKVKYMGDIVLLATVRDITQEKSDAREILRAKEYAKLIFDFAPSAIFTVDKKRIVRSWNKKAEELTGYTAQETIGKQCMLFAVTPCSEICGLFSKNPNVPIKSRECSIRSKSGDIIIARKHADYLYDGNNEIVGGIESFENITDIKNAEMELRRSEERFKQVAESAEEWIWEVDMNGLYTYSSSMVGSILGYKADEVVGKMHFYDFFDAERRDEIAKSIFDGIKKREVFRGFVNKNTHKNGNTVWLSSTATPILDDEDNLIGYRGADTDVTDRISAEETAERHFIEMEQMNDKIRNTLNVIQEKDQNIHDKNEELSKAYDKLAVVLDKTNLQKELFSDEKDRLDAIIQQMGEGVIVINSKNEISIMNERAKEIIGYSADEEIPESYKKMFVLQMWKEISEGSDEVIHKEVKIERPKERDVLMNMVRVKERGIYGGFVVVLRDVTQERRIEKMKSDFVANVSHEIRSPMSPMKDALSLVLDKTAGPLNDQQERFLNILDGNLDRLLRLVNDLLDLSKIEAGKMSIIKERISLPCIVEETVESMLVYAERRNIGLDCACESDIPQVECDRDRIVQVIINLVMNALKFTPDGGRVSVRVERYSDKNARKYIKVSVNDNGPGISNNEVEVLFNRFKQLASSTKVKGTGLGLSISKAIIEIHGGSIWVESEKDKGSSFNFTIPM